jgi:hypothetical protein
MQLTPKEIWTALHGMFFGAGFLLAFAGVFAAICGMRAEWLSPVGVQRRRWGLIFGVWFLAIASWAAVIVGTYVVYPWYRAKPPVSATSLTDYPRYQLLAHPKTASWHNFGMEWKEHVAWLTPILATAVAVIVMRHRRQIVEEPALRRMVLFMLAVAFFAALVAGGMGAFINKMAPTR